MTCSDIELRLWMSSILACILTSCPNDCLRKIEKNLLDYISPSLCAKCGMARGIYKDRALGPRVSTAGARNSRRIKSDDLCEG